MIFVRFVQADFKSVRRGDDLDVPPDEGSTRRSCSWNSRTKSEKKRSIHYINVDSVQVCAFSPSLQATLYDFRVVPVEGRLFMSIFIESFSASLARFRRLDGGKRFSGALF